MHPLADISSMLERFRTFRTDSNARKIESFKTNFQQLAEKLKPLHQSASERAKKYAQDFNIFRILRLERREVTTHTPFLANLLDPSGSHAQGDLFLRLFWKQLSEKAVDSMPQVQAPALVEHSRWAIHTERVMDLGNFDIHFKCRSMLCQMVIENKIGAGDQKDQLPRYWTQMEKELAYYPQRLIVYLTPQARKPNNYEGTLPPFVNLTYKEDIALMLTTALESIVASRLQFTLEQYLDIIESL